MEFAAAEFGMAIFVVFLLLALGLYLIDQYRRIDLSLPFGRTIPYTLAVIGASIFFFASEGLIGLFKGIATAVVIGFVMQGVDELKTDG